MAIGDMMGMMKQARELQTRMEQLQQEVAALEVTGTAGGGLVTVTMTGKSEMKHIRLDPSLLEELAGFYAKRLPNGAATVARSCRLTPPTTGDAVSAWRQVLISRVIRARSSQVFPRSFLKVLRSRTQVAMI